MRQRYLILLVMLTVSMGTVVLASGISHQELPAAQPEDGAEASEASVRLIELPPNRFKAVSHAHSKHSDHTPAPRAAEQDPHRDPRTEVRAAPEPPPPGGVAGVDLPEVASGKLLVQEGAQAAPAGYATYAVRIEVEEGLPISLEEFSEFVMDSLNHDRSWAKDGAVAFSRTDGDAAIRIILASPATTDELCTPLSTNGTWSCGRSGRAVINADRWINSSPAFEDAGGDIVAYRHYLLNHEIGHLIGYDHVGCPTPGEPAPVMLQQSIGLQGCTPNGWVHP